MHQTERQVVELALAIARPCPAPRGDRSIASCWCDGARGARPPGRDDLGDHPPAIPTTTRRIGARTPARRQAGRSRSCRPGRQPGGCLVQTDFGLIDAGVDAQLTRAGDARSADACRRPSWRGRGRRHESRAHSRSSYLDTCRAVRAGADHGRGRAGRSGCSSSRSGRARGSARCANCAAGISAAAAG